MKFKVGDIVIYVGIPRDGDGGTLTPGEELEIFAVGPWSRGDSAGFRYAYGSRGGVVDRDRSDYIAGNSQFASMFVESELRMRQPPEEPQVTKLKEDIEKWTKSPAKVAA